MPDNSDRDFWLVITIGGSALVVGFENLRQGQWWYGGIFTLGGLLVMAPASPLVRSLFHPAFGRSALWALAVANLLFLGAYLWFQIQSLSAPPPFTVKGTGCTPTNVTGYGTVGTFTLAPGPCKAVTITIDPKLEAPKGWHCDAGDRTQLAKGIWFGEWTEQDSTKTTVTIPIPPAAYQNVDSKGNAGTDVISFACRAY